MKAREYCVVRIINSEKYLCIACHEIRSFKVMTLYNIVASADTVQFDWN
jgi:hypothetical protein